MCSSTEGDSRRGAPRQARGRIPRQGRGITSQPGGGGGPVLRDARGRGGGERSRKRDQTSGQGSGVIHGHAGCPLAPNRKTPCDAGLTHPPRKAGRTQRTSKDTGTWGSPWGSPPQNGGHMRSSVTNRRRAEPTSGPAADSRAHGDRAPMVTSQDPGWAQGSRRRARSLGLESKWSFRLPDS